MLDEAFTGGDGVRKGLTVGEAILSEQRFELAQTNERAETTKLKSTLTATLKDKRFVPSEQSANGDEGEIAVQFVCRNEGKEDIAGFKAIISFANSTGDVIREERINHNKGLPAGKSVTCTGSVGYHRSDETSERLRSIDPSSLRFSFTPQAIVFADGTTLQAPYEERMRKIQPRLRLPVALPSP
ncbi:MAG: hypothetical protein H0U99_04005 [Chthoniobacterales bacterium]|nr:hypothetical protein [Chthoniobacterales bacterium]